MSIAAAEVLTTPLVAGRCRSTASRWLRLGRWPPPALVPPEVSGGRGEHDRLLGIRLDPPGSAQSRQDAIGSSLRPQPRRVPYRWPYTASSQLTAHVHFWEHGFGPFLTISERYVPASPRNACVGARRERPVKRRTALQTAAGLPNRQHIRRVAGPGSVAALGRARRRRWMLDLRIGGATRSDQCVSGPELPGVGRHRPRGRGAVRSAAKHKPLPATTPEAGTFPRAAAVWGWKPFPP